MNYFKAKPNVLLDRHVELQDQPIFWQYLRQYPNMNGFKLYMPLTLSLFFTGYYAYAYYFSLIQQINVLKHRDIYDWVQHPSFSLFWLISIFSPFILLLKTKTIFQCRYLIGFLIILHAYPLFLYGTSFATAIFLCSVLFPLLFEYERGKIMP